ncbi:MAG TPA: acyltransferase [Caulobacteraceae bacterium]|nr:acyltransferase [Caulobacteraceae bacterium]
MSEAGASVRDGPAMASPLAYRPQLDGLRALAVTAVLFHHFWSPETDAGSQGVRTFFVLSGLLITQILLQPRAGSTMQAMASFYIRRSLRIFPIYFVVVLAAIAVIPEVRATALWHLTYTSNFLFAVEGEWAPWMVSHLWSLDVEEQFYLLWAPFVLLAPRRLFLPVTIALIAAAPLCRAAFEQAQPGGPAAYGLLPGSMDALGVGALLAVVERRRLWPGLKPGLLLIGGLLALPVLFVVWWNTPLLMGHGVWVDTVALIPIAAIVLGASRGASGVVGRVLASAPLIGLGKISYGVYLLHLLVLWALLKTPVFAQQPHGPATFVVGTAVTIALAALSWRVLERPLNGLKRRYPYAAAVPVVKMQQSPLRPSANPLDDGDVPLERRGPLGARSLSGAGRTPRRER